MKVKGFKNRTKRPATMMNDAVKNGVSKYTRLDMLLSKAEYIAKIQAQHGPVRVLVKDGKPVNPPADA